MLKRSLAKPLQFYINRRILRVRTYAHKLRTCTPSDWRAYLVYFIGLAIWPAGLGVVCLAIMCSCAPKNFNHLEAQTRETQRRIFLNRYAWSGPCERAKVDRAYAKLLNGEGSPWAAIYYMRCVRRDDWVSKLVPRRARVRIMR